MFSHKKIMGLMLITIISLTVVGCSDDNPVDPGILDEAPIVPPTKLTVQLDKGKAMLEWRPSVDTRVVNYFVDRENDGELVSLGKVGNSETQYVDNNPLVGQSTYYVYAAGTGSRNSATVSASLFITLNHQTHDMQD